MKKRNINDCSFAHLTLIMLLHYLVKCRVIVWTFTTMNSNSVSVSHVGSESHCETTKSLKICYLFNINQEQDLVPRSQTSTNWNDASTLNSEWAAPSHTVIECAVWEWRNVYAFVFMLEGTFWAHTVIKMIWC